MSLTPTANGPLADRLIAFAQAHSRPIEALALAAGVGLFLASVLPNLANHPALTDDEMWVLSSAYKLAQQGVFGSDLFTGFYHADQRYYFNLPAHHLAVAAAIKLLGAGIWQARLVGVGYGLATIGLTYLLARRLYGVPAAILTLGLLLCLRLNIGFDTGLPLQEESVNLRYDLAPVPFALAGVLVLLGGPSWRRAALAGGLFGLAGLFQFYGLFFLPLAAIFLWLEALPVAQRARLVAVLAATAVIVWLPYAGYALSHYDDFRGQVSLTTYQRDGFGHPGFYLDNLRHEPDRFLRPLAFKEVPRGADPDLVDPRWLSLKETLTRRPSAKLAILAGLPLALVYCGRRALRERSRGDRLLLLCLGGLALEYALLESTKFYIYWMPVVPFLCIGIAAAALALLRWPWTRPRQLAVAGLVGGLLLLAFAEGAAARIGGWRTAPRATDYAQLGVALHQYVPSGSRVVGTTALWWALHDTDYRSELMFFYVTGPDAGPYRATVSGYLDGLQAQYLVLTRFSESELQKKAPAQYAELQAYLQAHADPPTRVDQPAGTAYDYVDVWRLR